MQEKTHYDVIVAGAGASGLMCALTAGQRGRSVLILEKAKKVGKKILISGGGRCNFTNQTVSAENYISENPYFCKSALSRFDNYAFLEYVYRHQISFHERAQGRLFCDGTAREIVDLLLEECRIGKVHIRTNSEILEVVSLSGEDKRYQVETDSGRFTCHSLVIATGGLSIPKMGSSGWGYQLAKKFGLKVVPCKPGLTPLKWGSEQFETLAPLSGISVESSIRVKKKVFTEPMLFTHQGISGPVVLQASNYWKKGESLKIDLLPGENLFRILEQKKKSNPQMELKTAIGEKLPRRLVQSWLALYENNKPLQNYSQQGLKQVSEWFHCASIIPSGTVGYSVAEVTLGGVDTNELSSKTMESKKAPGLFFIGEVVDVTGWLGGYNFQWAWASGHCAGAYV